MPFPNTSNFIRSVAPNCPLYTSYLYASTQLYFPLYTKSLFFSIHLSLAPSTSPSPFHNFLPIRVTLSNLSLSGVALVTTYTLLGPSDPTSLAFVVPT